MLTRSRQTPKRGTTCQRCLVIRYFVMAALAVAVFSVIVGDSMRYLGFVTPMRAGLAIVGFGILGFAIKFVLWRMEARAALSAGPGPGEPPEAGSPGNDHKSSH